ncbi:DNA damage-binding protein 1a [Coemansia sp. RSA 1933]|nr:DNA damage-binding protein 1a [Coemansia sp. RSA 1933]
MLLVTSEKRQFAILAWDAAEHSLVTESTGEIGEITGRAATEGRAVSVDPETRLIAVYAYQGIVHLFPMAGAQAQTAWRALLRSTYSGGMTGTSRRQGQENGSDDERWPYAVREDAASKLCTPAYLQQLQTGSAAGAVGVQGPRSKGKAVAHPARSTDLYSVLTRYIRELKVLDMQFLRTGTTQSPELAVLFEDANMARHVHVYRISDDHGEMKPESSWTSAPVEGTASMLVPLLGGAVMVVGNEALTVVSDAQQQPLSISKRQAAVTAWQWIDEARRERLLVADDAGVLSLVVVRYAKASGAGAAEKVQALDVERLGDIPVATSLSYLSDGCLYIGSHFGDQVLVRLHTQPLSEEAIEKSSSLTLHRSLAAAASHSDVYSPLEQPLGLGSAVTPQTTPNTFVEPLAIFQNLAPVVDLHVVGVDSSQADGESATPLADDRRAVAGGSNYGSVVTCSGERNSTSLRVVRNGVGIQSLAHAGIDGLVGAWSLTVDAAASEDPGGAERMDVDGERPRARLVLIVLALVQGTRIVGWTEPTASPDAELAELSLPGWRLDERTITCGLTADGRCAIQVTAAGVVLVRTSTWQQAAEWTPAQIGLRAITAASVRGNQLALAVDGTTVAYLEVHESVVCVAQRRLEHAVACIDIHAWGSDQGAESAYVALGLWEINDIRLLRLPNLEQAPVALSLLAMPGGLHESARAVEAATAAMRRGGRTKESAPSGDGLPRSILMCTLGHTPYLLVGMGDGRLHQFAMCQHPQQPGDMDDPALSVSEHKCVALGSRPLQLTPFVNHGVLSVFAASDRPSVLFASQRHTADPASGISRLLYANVDAADIAQAAPINSAMFPEALCIVYSDGSLSIGRADPAQRLHVHSLPLPNWAAPHRLALHHDAALYGVATIHAVDPDALAVSLADLSLWEREALMHSNAQQGSQVPDIRSQLVVRPPQEVGRFSLLDSNTTECLGSVLLRPYEIPESLCLATLDCLQRPDAEASTECGGGVDQAAEDGFSEPAQSLQGVFVLGTSIVMPEADDASSGRILVAQWDALLRRMRILGCFTTHGAVYSLVPFRGMLLAAANNRLLLLAWQRRDPAAVLPPPMREIRHVGFNAVYLEDVDYELVVVCSQQTQIASLSIAVSGDHVAVGDIMSSASVYRYEEFRIQPRPIATEALQQQQPQQQGPGVLHRRLVPVSRDYTNAWTTCVAATPQASSSASVLFPPYIAEEAGVVGGQHLMQPIPDYAAAFCGADQKRFLVSDAYSNLFRLAMADGAAASDPQRLFVEARWHLGDQINVIRAGSLVMDVADPEFPDAFRPTLVYGTLRGAVGVIANVDNGKLGRILDRLQTNMAHLLPTPGLWDYDTWRSYASDQRSSRAFGFLDGDLIELFLDLPREIQMLIFVGGSPLLADAQTISLAEHSRKAQYWLDYSRVEAEGEVAVLSQMAVSDIGQREGVSLDYVVRLVECVARLH